MKKKKDTIISDLKVLTVLAVLVLTVLAVFFILFFLVMQEIDDWDYECLEEFSRKVCATKDADLLNRIGTNSLIMDCVKDYELIELSVPYSEIEFCFIKKGAI